MRFMLLLIPAAVFAQSQNLPEAAARGKSMFFDQGPRCSRCHQAEGRGTKVGPDITRLARLHPKGIKTAILATLTEYVVQVQLTNGKRFPAIREEENDKTVRLYDLSGEVPEEKTLDKSTIAAFRNNGTWKHPPTAMGLTDQQLADLMSYIRFVGYGERTPVTPADIK
jgi:putative heme-binding domain-containing protein